MQTTLKLKLRGATLFSDDNLISFSTLSPSIYDDLVDINHCDRIIGSSGSLSLSSRSSRSQRVPTDIVRFSWRASRILYHDSFVVDSSIAHRGADYLAYNISTLLDIIVGGSLPNGSVARGSYYASRFVNAEMFEITFSGSSLEVTDPCDPAATSGISVKASATQYVATSDCSLREITSISVRLLASYEAYGNNPIDAAYSDMFQTGLNIGGFIIRDTLLGTITQEQSDNYIAQCDGNIVSYGV